MSARIIEFPTHMDRRGHLSVIEKRDLPFEVKRIFYVYGCAPDAWRGGHALRTCHLLLVPIAGSLTLGADDEEYFFDDPSEGFHIPPMTWIELDEFSDGAAYFVLASEEFDESNYICDYDEFLKEKGEL